MPSNGSGSEALIYSHGRTETHRLLTPRDTEILAALDRCPLTASQILKSARPSRAVHQRAAGAVASPPAVRVGPGVSVAVRHRRPGSTELLHALAARISAFCTATTAVPPTKRAFGPVASPSSTTRRCLADFVVQTPRPPTASGVDFTGFYRENTLRLQVGEECLYPDNAFQLVEPDGSDYRILHGDRRGHRADTLAEGRRELGTEDPHSTTACRIQRRSGFGVLIVSTRSRERVRSHPRSCCELDAKSAPVALLRHQPAGYLAGGPPPIRRVSATTAANRSLLPRAIFDPACLEPSPMRVLPPSRLPSLTT